MGSVDEAAAGALTYWAECLKGCGAFGKTGNLDDAGRSAARHYEVSGHDARVESCATVESPVVAEIPADVALWQDKYREADRAYIEANRKHHESLAEIRRLTVAIDGVIAEMVGMDRAGSSIVSRDWVVRRLSRAKSGEASEWLR